MYKKDFVVEEGHSAQAMGSGDLDVLSTPSLIAFMEYTAKEIVAPQLGETETTVGIEMNMKHMKATAVGQTVTVVANLIAQNKTILTFTVEAFEEDTLIGKGKHTRAIVNREKFMARL